MRRRTNRLLKSLIYRKFNSMKEFWKAVGYSSQWWYYMRKSGKLPHIGTLRKIAELLEVSVEELIELFMQDYLNNMK